MRQEVELLKQERDTYRDRFQRALRESQTQREQLERQISQNDQQLFRPLRSIPIPPNASAVAGSIWPYEWLIFAAGHPVLLETSAAQTRNILEQLRLHRANATARCASPHSCVMRTTGPDVYINGLYRAAKAANCSAYREAELLRANSGVRIFNSSGYDEAIHAALHANFSVAGLGAFSTLEATRIGYLVTVAAIAPLAVGALDPLQHEDAAA